LQSPLLKTQITANDPVVVSTMDGSYALAIGFVVQLTESHIELALDRPIRGSTTDMQQRRFRIDKDELAAGMGTVRDNLVQLFTSRGDERRRQLVVDLAPPRFVSAAEYQQQRQDECGIEASLNRDQREAVNRVLQGIVH